MFFKNTLIGLEPSADQKLAAISRNSLFRDWTVINKSIFHYVMHRMRHTSNQIYSEKYWIFLDLSRQPSIPQSSGLSTELMDRLGSNNTPNFSFLSLKIFSHSSTFWRLCISQTYWVNYHVIFFQIFFNFNLSSSPLHASFLSFYFFLGKNLISLFH